MKTILLMCHDDSGQEARLQCALDVTRATEGHLVGLDLVRMPVVVDSFGIGVATASMVMDESDQENDNVARLADRLKVEGVPYEFMRMRGDFDAAIAEAAHLVDLIVISEPGLKDLRDQGDLPGRLAAQTSVPILVVPTHCKGFDPAGKVLVAWDGSSAAAAAIRGAVPLLKAAAEVEVVTVAVRNCEADPQDVARFLARHDCHVTTTILPCSAATPGETLLEAFKSSQADWAVMGNYGHGRVREHLLGGTTKTMMAEIPLPLMIAH